jgi:hypothetical protein
MKTLRAVGVFWMLERFVKIQVLRWPGPLEGKFTALRDSSQLASSWLISLIEGVTEQLEWFSEEP